MGGNDAIIIGAGLAGLAAALRLGELGRWRPRLIEREREPGGLARSLHFGGFTTDLGPHRIYTEWPEVLRLIERVAAPSLVTVQRSSHIFLKGRFLKYPPAPMELAARLGPLAMARFMAGYAAGRLRPAPREETYESLMVQAFGRPLYEFLLRPYSAKTWKIDPAALHADTARVRISATSLAHMVASLLGGGGRARPTSLKQFRYVRGGAETLVRHFWEQAQALGAELTLGRETRALELGAEGRVSAALLDPAPGATDVPDRVPGDFFLSTVPLPLLLGRLLPARPELAEAREAAAGLEFLQMILVCLVARRDRISDDSWLYFPEPHLVFNRAYEAKNFDATLAPQGRSLLCLEITHRAGDPLAGESDEALIATARRQLATTGLVREDEIEQGFAFRLSHAYPLYTLDYDRRLERALAGLRRIPNLITLGRQGLFNHNNMDHSILMGLRAAERLDRTGAEAAGCWYEGAAEFKNMRIID